MESKKVKTVERKINTDRVLDICSAILVNFEDIDIHLLPNEFKPMEFMLGLIIAGEQIAGLEDIKPADLLSEIIISYDMFLDQIKIDK
jgi:hypothetical protein